MSLIASMVKSAPAESTETAGELGLPPVAAETSWDGIRVATEGDWTRPTPPISIGGVRPSVRVTYMPGYAQPVLTTQDQPNLGVILPEIPIFAPAPLRAARQTHLG
jgi:hypothetical protein